MSRRGDEGRCSGHGEAEGSPRLHPELLEGSPPWPPKYRSRVRPGRVRGSTAFLAHGFRMARDVLVTETQTQDVSLWAASERAVLIAKGRLRRARSGRRSCELLILSLGELNCRLDSELRTCCRRQGSATTWE